jgi:hypothetical protein
MMKVLMESRQSDLSLTAFSLWHNKREFVAAQTTGNIHDSQACLQYLTDLFQHGVSLSMSVSVVYIFEVVAVQVG